MEVGHGWKACIYRGVRMGDMDRGHIWRTRVVGMDGGIG